MPVKFRSLGHLTRERSPYRFSPTSDPETISELMDRYINLTFQLGLAGDEAAALLDVTTSTWSRYKSGKHPPYIGQDKKMRIYYLHDLVSRLSRSGKDIQFFFEKQDMGLSEHVVPLRYMLTHGLPAIHDVWSFATKSLNKHS